MEPKVKHFIITRFLTNCKMSLGNKVFEKETIDCYLEMFKKYLIKSLENQTNKNFEFIICIHQDVNKKYIQDLFDFATRTDFKTTIIEINNSDFSNLNKYIRSQCVPDNCDYVITTRIDLDDEFYAGCVEEIQTSAKTPLSDVYIYTWRYHIRHIINEKIDSYCLVDGSFHTEGGTSQMLTLIQKNSSKAPLTNIYSIGNHTKCISILKEQYKNLTGQMYNNDPVVYIDQSPEPKLIYTINGQNDSLASKEHLFNKKLKNEIDRRIVSTYLDLQKYKMFEYQTKSIWIQFPIQNKKYHVYSTEHQITKIPIVDDLKSPLYSGMDLNGHHYTTEYHRKKVLPLLSQKLNFNFQEQDFHLIPYYIQQDDKKFDLSYLIPRQQMVLKLENFETGEIVQGSVSDVLDLKNSKNSPYHNLYRFPHQCSRIKNLTNKNGRKLLISGDSQMVPNLMVLAYYFEEIVYLDNRTGLNNKEKKVCVEKTKSFFDKFKDTKFTDVLIELYTNDLERYLEINFT